MSATDLIRERMKKEKEIKPKKESKKQTQETSEIELDELSSRVGDSSLKRLRIESEYEGRRTISASIPAWIKAALDYVAIAATKSGEGKYGGFGGKSRFIAEALEAKIKSDFPEVFEKLQRKS